MATLKDYLHFHVPCKCLRTDTGKEVRLIGIDDLDVNWHPDDKCVRFEGGLEWKWSAVETSIKPILRPLSSMTSQEASELALIDREPELTWASRQAEKIKHLLKKGFDVFGLIEKGLAISSVSKA